MGDLEDSVCMSPDYKTDQLMTCSVGIQGEEEFYCTLVHARNQVEERKKLWSDICHHHDSPFLKIRLG